MTAAAVLLCVGLAACALAAWLSLRNWRGDAPRDDGRRRAEERIGEGLEPRNVRRVGK